MEKNKDKKYTIPLYDPYTGELNPYYEEITGKKHPFSVEIKDNKIKKLLKKLLKKILKYNG